MGDLWGCRIPIRCYQRGFRPTYRNAINSTVVFDQSYLKSLQIENLDDYGIDAILKLLSKFTIRGISASFGLKLAMNGGLEMSVLVYEPEKYPHGYIGPVRFLWIKNRLVYIFLIHF